METHESPTFKIREVHCERCKAPMYERHLRTSVVVKEYHSRLEDCVDYLAHRCANNLEYIDELEERIHKLEDKIHNLEKSSTDGKRIAKTKKAGDSGIQKDAMGSDSGEDS